MSEYQYEIYRLANDGSTHRIAVLEGLDAFLSYKAEHDVRWFDFDVHSNITKYLQYGR